MNDLLTNLLALQSVDDEVRGFRTERDTLREKISRLKELLALMTTALNEKCGKLDDASRWYREKEAELRSDNDKVKKAKIKLQSVTKNREYMAMQREIESLRKAYLAKEEEMLKLVQAIEEFKTSISAEEEKIAEIQKEVSEEETSNAKRLSKLDEQISAISGRKNVILEKITPNIIRKYERIASSRSGIVVVSVATSGACGGCNFRITPRQLQLVYRGDSMETCPNCDRILYLTTEDTSDKTNEATEDVSVADAR